MAVRLICKSRAVATLNSNLRSLAQSLQAFSSDAKRGHGLNLRTDESSTEESSTTTVWPDPSLGFLGPQDRRLPLPGNIGFGNELFTHIEHTTSAIRKQQLTSVGNVDCDVLNSQLAQERHLSVLSQALSSKQDGLMQEEVEVPSAGDILECVAHECPQLIRKDFADLFPGMDTMSGPFTVITLSQRTDNDMSGWDYEVEVEREELMLYFVIAAEEICSNLKELGFWADFIDPSSGRPYLGPYTNATMFETDERYRHFGFRIEDLGCCKVVTHRVWGTNVFVGSLFTNAPVDSSHIKTVLERHSCGGSSKTSGHIN